ncbi:TPA: triphosphoribosyl-dephospho-CoA synthase [Vibrio cholerae]
MEAVRQTLPLSCNSRISKICDCVEQALILEASAHPKPGLVTKLCNGSHSDMNFSTFLESAKAISTVFRKELSTVLDLVLLDRDDLAIEALRGVGRKAEFAMYRSTNGVNTHKGAIFLMLTVIYGIFWGAQSYHEAVNNAKKYCYTLTRVDGSEKTTGARAYAQGIRGIRGVVQDGFPSIIQFQPRLITERKTLGEEFAIINNLLGHMSVTEDTTLLNRHFDPAVITHVQNKAQAVINSGGILSVLGSDLISSLNDDLVDKLISPGGSADLTAVSLFLVYYYK